MEISSSFIEKSVVARITGLQGIQGNFQQRNYIINYCSVSRFRNLKARLREPSVRIPRGQYEEVEIH